MFTSYNADTADDVWQKIATDFRRGDGVTQQESRAGRVREMMHVGLSIQSPQHRWVISREPPLNPAFAIAEVVWIVNGRNDAAFLNFFNSSLPKFAGTGHVYDGAYGYRLRHHLGFDQLERAFAALLKRPMTRQVVLQIWDGRVDFPGAVGEETSPDVPCNVVSLLKVRDGRLEWMQVLRSNDFVRGQPYNFVQFTTLQEIIAGWLGLASGAYHQVTDSLHVYEGSWKELGASLPIRCPSGTSSLALSYTDSTSAFRELARWVERIMHLKSPAASLCAAAENSLLPPAYKDFLFVLLCEGLRRHGCLELASEQMAKCGDPVYRLLLDRWFARVQPRGRRENCAG